MRTVTFFLFCLLVLACSAASANKEMNKAYKLARQALDPDNDLVMNEHYYRVDQLSKCKVHECESQGPEHLTKLNKAEIDWFKTVHKAIIALRRQYPTETGTVWCAIYSVLQNPEICQMHHASAKVAELTFLVQKDLATDTLVEALNDKATINYQ